MRPAARVQTAIELLDALSGGQKPADQILGNCFRRSRFIGSKDRRAIRDLVYGVIRKRARLTARLAQYGAAADARSLVIAWLAIEGDEPPGGFFDGSDHAPAPLTGTEADMAAELAHFHDDIDLPLETRLEVPDWLAGELRQSFGPAFETEMQALNREAPVDLRVNSLKSDRDSEIATLIKAGIDATATLFSPDGIRLGERLTLGNHASYREGHIEVQDEGSQIAGLLSAASPGMTVIDYCAGAGGKTLALAAAMAGKGHLTACDIDGRRLAELQVRAETAGITGMLSYRALDGDDDPWLAEHREIADLVLVDAPCSGIGAWRRSPDARWLLTPERLDRYRDLQQGILECASALVKPGGRLVYITCSLLESENSAQIEGFLAGNSRFAKNDLGASASALGLPGGVIRDGMVTLSPATTGTDGFFIAAMERRQT
jgi:16S rRNA (cytosine967-C5)-methyltransferase